MPDAREDLSACYDGESVKFLQTDRSALRRDRFQHAEAALGSADVG